MSEQKLPREFIVTRTKDNHQLGLTVLIESLELGETKSFVEKSAYDRLKDHTEKLAEALQKISLETHLLGTERTSGAICASQALAHYHAFREGK